MKERSLNMTSGVGVKGYGLEFNRKSGEVVKCLEGNVPMLRTVALRGLGKTRDYVVVGTDNKIYQYVEGTGSNQFPKIHKDMDGMDAKKMGIDVSLF
jgi:hypothetical protein